MTLYKSLSPETVKKLSFEEKEELCAEIRQLLIGTVSKNGGHLASNLGTVELTVALHTVFSTPEDKIIFDVGHQSYTHKILTGRLDRFDTLRTEGGISGFPRPSESAHDAFIGGHSSISVSVALGIASAMKLQGAAGSVVAVAGDGAFTGGEIYEGINNARKDYDNLIIVLNDNEMSISKNKSALAAYLSRIRSSKGYFQAKTKVKTTLAGNAVGRGVSRAISGAKNAFKNVFIHENLFENLGLEYLGPIDGHDLKELTETFELAKLIKAPCLIHVKTKKGKGFIPAEENAGKYHGIDKQRNSAGQSPVSDDDAEDRAEEKEYEGNEAANSDVKSPCLKPDCPKSYSENFGKEILSLGLKDKKICLISAAMKYATGCNFFAKSMRERFFDAGIAEGHAVTFAAGLASQGMLPVFAVYSTFLQRGIDQLIHDAAIEKLHVVLAVDRAGLNGEDGETHLGIFDVPLLRSVPDCVIYSPAFAEEQALCLKKALYENSGVAVVRYPRGSAKKANADCNNNYKEIRGDFRHIKDSDSKASDILVITYGRLFHTAKKIPCADLLQLIQIHPIPAAALKIIKSYKKIVFFEESLEKGGVAEGLSAALLKDGWSGTYKTRAVPGFVKCADIGRQLELCGFDSASMIKFVNEA